MVHLYGDIFWQCYYVIMSCMHKNLCCCICTRDVRVFPYEMHVHTFQCVCMSCMWICMQNLYLYERSKLFLENCTRICFHAYTGLSPIRTQTCVCMRIVYSVSNKLYWFMYLKLTCLSLYYNARHITHILMAGHFFTQSIFHCVHIYACACMLHAISCVLQQVGLNAIIRMHALPCIHGHVSGTHANMLY